MTDGRQRYGESFEFGDLSPTRQIALLRTQLRPHTDTARQAEAAIRDINRLIGPRGVLTSLERGYGRAATVLGDLLQLLRTRERGDPVPLHLRRLGSHSRHDLDTRIEEARRTEHGLHRAIIDACPGISPEHEPLDILLRKKEALRGELRDHEGRLSASAAEAAKIAEHINALKQLCARARPRPRRAPLHRPSGAWRTSRPR